MLRYELNKNAYFVGFGPQPMVTENLNQELMCFGISFIYQNDIIPVLNLRGYSSLVNKLPLPGKSGHYFVGMILKSIFKVHGMRKPDDKELVEQSKVIFNRITKLSSHLPNWNLVLPGIVYRISKNHRNEYEAERFDGNQPVPALFELKKCIDDHYFRSYITSILKLTNLSSK